MQGDITVRSRPGEGSTFTFSLALEAAGPGAEQVAALADGLLKQAATQRLRVLVAEDHPVNRQYMAALLDNLGHQAHFTANGEEAVAAAREQSFDLVLMDLHMPVLDGLGATRAIRALANPTAATVPIVALTADGLDQTRQRCLVAGMNDFLTKPVSPQKLASSLRRLFGSAVCDGNSSPPAPGAPVPAASNPSPVVDQAALQMALKAMPRERLASLIDAYLNQGPQTVQRLRAAVRDAQPLELRVNAHAARGAALNLGLSALATTAEALHEGAAHLPAHEIARLVQRFEELLPLTREAVRAEGLEPTVGKVTR
jgi:two-component system, sensor histidine kinase